MKTILSLAILFCSGAALAGTVNIPPGGSATINPGEVTTVTCEAGSSSTHFCACGGEGFSSQYLIRIDFVGGRKVVSVLGDRLNSANCHGYLPVHIACK